MSSSTFDRRHASLAALALLALACTRPARDAHASAPTASGATGREPVVGGPCEDCDAVFQGLPSTIDSRVRLAPAGEPGERLSIEGVGRDGNERPVAGVVVYVHHTDATGIYPTLEGAPGEFAGRHGRLRGWARTDADGRYGFDTIRPASYPASDIPQHVHMQVLEPGRCTYWIDDLMFTDDPFLTEEKRRAYANGRGGLGFTEPRRDAAGTWHATRDITLGLGIPDYTERTR
jgi:protocatechuate 3,4-dioxygenase beta subunit